MGHEGRGTEVRRGETAGGGGLIDRQGLVAAVWAWEETSRLVIRSVDS